MHELLITRKKRKEGRGWVYWKNNGSDKKVCFIYQYYQSLIYVTKV